VLLEMPFLLAQSGKISLIHEIYGFFELSPQTLQMAPKNTGI
jgi:hypothetical protein